MRGRSPVVPAVDRYLQVDTSAYDLLKSAARLPRSGTTRFLTFSPPQEPLPRRLHPRSRPEAVVPLPASITPTIERQDGGFWEAVGAL